MVKAYVEGAYSRPSDKKADVVWIDYLAALDYETCIKAIKTHIKSGNAYPPSLADIQRIYDETRIETNGEMIELVLLAMAKDGTLDDADKESEVAQWNRSQRIRKIREWLSRGFIPDFVQKYIDRIKLLKLAPSNSLQIGG